MQKVPTETTRIKRPLLLPVAASFLGLMVLFVGAIFLIDRQYNDEKLSSLLDAIELTFLRKMEDQAALLSGHLLFISNTRCFQESWALKDKAKLKHCSARALDSLQGFLQIKTLHILDRDLNPFFSTGGAHNQSDINREYAYVRAATIEDTAYGVELKSDGSLVLAIARPWYRQETISGFIGMEISLRDALNHVSMIHDTSLVVYTDKSRIDRSAWDQRQTAEDGAYPWDQLPNHLVVYGDKSGQLSSPPVGEYAGQVAGARTMKRFSANGQEYATGNFPLLDQGGRLIGHVGITLDVSRQVQERWALIEAFVLLFVCTGTLFFFLFRRYLGRMERRIFASYQSLEQEINEREKMAVSLRKLSSAVEQSGSAVMITDKYGHIEYVNPKFSEVTGYQLAEIKSKTPSFLRSEITSTDTHKNLWSTILAGEPWVGDLRNRRKNGELYWNHLSIAPIVQTSGEITNFVATSEDITQMKNAQEEMERLAFFDILTNLPNRRLFRDRLQRTLSALRRSGDHAALMFLDLDQFKRINDTFGHDAGDTLLCEVATRLKDIVRDNDTIARLGGDEFTILVQQVKGLTAARKVAQKILGVLRMPFVLAGREVNVTTSIGITLIPEDGRDTGVLMKNADLAMYEAKERGRNNFQFFTKSMNDEVARRVLLEHELVNALRDNELELVYQPLMIMGSGQIDGVEALLRWRHPSRGLLAPNAFLSVAEESNIINQIGEWVLMQACREVSSLNRARGTQLSVSINLSARQFSNPRLVDIIKTTLEETHLESRLLHLEITESVLMEEHIDPIDTMVLLKQEGIYLSVDDFGTGYSSLSYLKRFPVDRLKVDRSFVRDIPQDVSDMEITAAIIVLAHKLNLEVVAEGVETAAQYHFLKRNQCDLLQGYLFSRPLPMAELAVKLNEIRTNFPREESVPRLPAPAEGFGTNT